MLLAIDVGNTHFVAGVCRDAAHGVPVWTSVWRKTTDISDTEDTLAVWLKGLFDLAGLPFKVDAAVCASVVPGLNDALKRLCRKWLGCEMVFVQSSPALGLEVRYNPPEAVGADRLANALGGLQHFHPPFVVVDFGTATTFDVIAADGAYVGGAILPGVLVSATALVGRTAKLPQIEFIIPERTIGTNTTESLQSGIIWGYAGAIDALASRIVDELGGEAMVIATGGLGGMFMGICKALDRYEPHLTLDGLAVAYTRMMAADIG